MIGRVDIEAGEIIPTVGRNRQTLDDKVPVNRESKTSVLAHRSFYGANYLLDAIGEKLGVTHDLKQCFPDTYRQILSIVYYLVLEDSTPVYRFEKWGTLQKHPYGKKLPRSVAASYSPASLKRPNRNSSGFRENEDLKRNSGPTTRHHCQVTHKLYNKSNMASTKRTTNYLS